MVLNSEVMFSECYDPSEIEFIFLKKNISQGDDFYSPNVIDILETN